MTEVQQNSLTRAWLLVKVENASKNSLAEQIYALNSDFTHPECKIRIVRADVVSGPYDIVVPAYTETPGEMEKIRKAIRLLTGVSAVETALVVWHEPFPTWDTEGYITREEAADYFRESRCADVPATVDASTESAPEELGHEPAGHSPWASAADDDSSDQPSEGSKGHRAW